ncbi:TatD family hydrolase [Desulfobacterales bacterium HSG2]|nr:TatD family hydrolase [Desulfobacterales bacterium HSG2]
MKLFDSHCHLDDRSYGEDMDEVIKRMNDADVAALMIVGIDKNRSKKAVALAESHANFYASVGIHPHFAKDCSESAVKSLRRLAESRKVRAWGEIGLDFNRMFSSREDQEKGFVRQLEAADDLRLPLIFHERESSGRFLEILKTHYVKRTGVVHCFSGNQRELEGYLELGLYIGVTGILTMKTRGAGLRKLVPLIPEDRVLIETDAPFLTPAPEKNQTRRNEPAFVRSVLFKLAEVRKEDPEYLSQVTWGNACRLFGVQSS